MSTDLGDPRPRRHLVFAIVALGMVMTSLDQTIVATALGAIQHDLHTEVNWSTWTITVYTLGQVLVLPLAGRLADQFGRRRVYLAAVLVFTLSSLCCGLAPNIYFLVVLRGVQALGGGALTPSASGIIADYFGRERERALGMFTGIYGIGGMTGPVLGGVFVTYWSWRGIFLINVPVGVLLLVLVTVFIGEGRPAGARALDGYGIVLLGLVLLSAMTAISLFGTAHSGLAYALAGGGAAVALAAGALFVRRAQRAAHPIIPASLLYGRGFGLMNVLNFTWGVALLGFGALVPLYAEQRYGIRPLGAGTLLTARAIGTGTMTILLALVIHRTGFRKPLIAGFVISGIGLIGLWLMPLGLSPYNWLAVNAALTGIGTGVASPASNVAVLDRAAEGVASIAGVRMMFRMSGGIAGIAIMSAVTARSHDHGEALGDAFLALAVVMFALVPLVMRLPERTRAAPPPPAQPPVADTAESSGKA